MDTIVKHRLDELAAPRRNHFFYGKLLDELHLGMEQDYFSGKRWMLNRLALGRGVLCGLNVTQDGKYVWVSPGVAIDAFGREIVVPRKVRVDPSKIAADCQTVRDRATDEPNVYLALCYRECKADFVPVLVTECEPQDQCAPSTTVESYCLEVRPVREGDPAPLTSVDLCGPLTDGTDAEDKRKRLCEALTKAPCETVSGNSCVVLATIKVAQDGTVGDIDCCTFRERVYSNAQLFELLLCLDGEGQGPRGPAGKDGPEGKQGPAGKQGADGKQGPEGKQGPDGKQGPKGDAGPGLESKLTRIVAASWVHAHAHAAGDSPFVPITGRIINASGTVDFPFGTGLVIGFSGPVRFRDPANPGALPLPLFPFPLVLEVMIRAPGVPPQLASWYSVSGILVPITRFTPATGRITSAILEVTTPPAPVTGFAFVTGKPEIDLMGRSDIVLVKLRGDFVVDMNGKALDAEFPRAQFPSGDGPPGSELGLQGGTFESWFGLSQRDAPAVVGPARAAPVLLNTATVFDLAVVPGIGMDAAEAIVAAREKKKDKRFHKVDELKGIGGLDERLLKVVKPNIKI